MEGAASVEPNLTRLRRPTPFSVSVTGFVGVLGIPLAVIAVRTVQFNVANSTTVVLDVPTSASSMSFLLFVALALALLCISAVYGNNTFTAWRRLGDVLAPVVLVWPLAIYAFVDTPPPFVLGNVLILGIGWTAFRAGVRAAAPLEPASAHFAALILIGIVVVITTWAHTQLQTVLFEHFMLGHADIGHFTEELKNALLGRGLRSDSFENTRLGWHFTPLLFALAPGYALWPSLVYLMVCGPLLLHLPAFAVYALAKKFTGSALMGLQCAIAWILLPSVSRMVYSNTYGFQWVVAAVPLLAFLLHAVLSHRWRMVWVWLVLVWLCEETTTAVTLGLGICITLVTPRKKTGMAIALGSIVYFALCVGVLIPRFSASGRYERLDLFGELGRSVGELALSIVTQPGAILVRLAREQGLLFVITLLTPLAMLPLLHWRLALSAAPTLFLILLLKNPEWVSIKFWHQATILPILVFAALATLRTVQDSAARATRILRRFAGGVPCPPQAMQRGIAHAVFVSAALSHYLYGFSPLSKSFDAFACDAALQTEDPRLQTVDTLRELIPRDQSVLASERLAAHFTDYRRIYTGLRAQFADWIIIDRGDLWDGSGLPARSGELAADPAFETFGEYGSIIVLRRRPEFPPLLRDAPSSPHPVLKR